jgi:hypothetical protein
LSHASAQLEHKDYEKNEKANLRCAVKEDNQKIKNLAISDLFII